MKKYLLSTLIIVSSLSFTANGALLVKKNVTIRQSASVAYAIPTFAAESVIASTENTSTIVSRQQKPKFRNLAELPKGVYIAMCILPLGWLAIAINSNFTENEWIFALLWYVLLYLPGVYYSLRQMKRFYGR